MGRKVRLIASCVWLLGSALGSSSLSLFGERRALRPAFSNTGRHHEGRWTVSLSVTGDEIGDTQLLNDTIASTRRTTRPNRNPPADTHAPPGTKTKPRTPRKRKSTAAVDAPAYWLNGTDTFWLEYAHNEQASSVGFQVRGNPRPLRRHRTARGFMYNPSSAFQEAFRQVVHRLVWPDIAWELETHEPLFSEEEQLAISLVFYMKRPKKHFVNSKPGPGRLRDGAPPRLSPSRTDVDNLAKFVLDSLNGLLYVDDRQVASIQATKLLHDDDECEGCTQVRIHRLTDDDIDTLLNADIPAVT